MSEVLEVHFVLSDVCSVHYYVLSDMCSMRYLVLCGKLKKVLSKM